MKKLDVKKLIKISAVALAMISAGGVASAVNANADVVSRDIAIANKINNGQSAQIKRDETHAEIMGDRTDPDALAEDVDYNYSFVKHHKSQLFRGLPKSVINYAKLNRESMLKKGTSTSFTYDDYVKSLKSHKSRKHVTRKRKATKRTRSHKRRITKHHKSYKRINRKRSCKNHKYIRRSHRIARHHKRK